jgi:hypothetical protein
LRGEAEAILILREIASSRPSGLAMIQKAIALSDNSSIWPQNRQRLAAIYDLLKTFLGLLSIFFGSDFHQIHRKSTKIEDEMEAMKWK